MRVLVFSIKESDFSDSVLYLCVSSKVLIFVVKVGTMELMKSKMSELFSTFLFSGGRQYSKQQVSFLSNACREDINAWLLRPLSQRYLALYIEATYVLFVVMEAFAKRLITAFYVCCLGKSVS